MRKPINFIQGEAVEGKWKQELLIYLGKEFGLNTLIETGTCDGGTLAGVYQHFTSCISIELSEHYYLISRARFVGAKNVLLHQGNSAVQLPKMLSTLPPFKGLFWLDAHSSGGLTANEGDPLPDEIKAITQLSPDSLIVIDDQQNALLVQVPAQYLNGYTIEYRYGVVFLYKTGLYNIPEFE